MEEKNDESLEQESPLEVVEDFTSAGAVSPVVIMEITYLDTRLSDKLYWNAWLKKWR